MNTDTCALFNWGVVPDCKIVSLGWAHLLLLLFFHLGTPRFKYYVVLLLLTLILKLDHWLQQPVAVFVVAPIFITDDDNNVGNSDFLNWMKQIVIIVLITLWILECYSVVNIVCEPDFKLLWRRNK